jgi:transcriptional regulator with PAS, ATPase and Fis domain
MVSEGSFREDLLQRLNAFEFRIPPLRDRPEDIALYANLFLSRRWEGQAFTLTNDGLNTLLTHAWPGNVRELENTIERIVVMAEKRIVDSTVVSSVLRIGERSGAEMPHRKENLSRAMVLNALQAVNGNRTRAAASLGVHLSTFQRWLIRFEIRDTIRGTPGRPSVLKDTKTHRTLGGSS